MNEVCDREVRSDVACSGIALRRNSRRDDSIEDNCILDYLIAFFDRRFIGVRISLPATPLVEGCHSQNPSGPTCKSAFEHGPQLMSS